MNTRSQVQEAEDPSGAGMLGRSSRPHIRAKRVKCRSRLIQPDSGSLIVGLSKHCGVYRDWCLNLLHVKMRFPWASSSQGVPDIWARHSCVRWSKPIAR
jgi:hypothetical protein